jgi:hypothetical protein
MPEGEGWPAAAPDLENVKTQDQATALSVGEGSAYSLSGTIRRPDSRELQLRRLATRLPTIAGAFGPDLFTI